MNNLSPEIMSAINRRRIKEEMDAIRLEEEEALKGKKPPEQKTGCPGRMDGGARRKVTQTTFEHANRLFRTDQEGHLTC